MQPTIFITGAPGNVGTEVVNILKTKAPIRVGANRVENAREQLGSGVECVHFNFLEPNTFSETFSGIDSVFLVRPPQLSNVDRDIAPALNAAKQSGIKKIVFLSLQGVEQNRMTPHYKIEKLILGLGFDYVFLRASFFMQNLSTMHLAEIRDRNEIAVPVGKAKTSFIDVRDIAAVAAKVLTDQHERNKMYTLTGGQALDYAEVSQIMSSVLGRTIHYRNPSVFTFIQQQLRSGKPLSYALVVAGLYTITRFGNAAEVTSDVEKLLGRPPITVAQFVDDYKEVWSHIPC